ncbi:hypothetical protein B0T24DRAFT_618001 [Lasiosphaeria ovina]|uniref:DUF7371 domain-containing protein n=1 Tax=Lasiosphaeria ovina TaxID=92902 RepID=A0AAE0KGJ7_9PEZI|nr:hypothetical protein B0T24DRAFT_618001 [Lasiosphaeria ovina]
MVQYNTSSSAIAQIGVGQFRENPCFRFDFLGLGLGCNSTDQPCVFNVTGLQWNGLDETVQATRSFEITPCPGRSNCTLSHQVLDSAAALQFTNLTSINITLAVAGQPQTWWADDLQLSWTDNACTSASCRAKVPDTIMIPHKFGHLATRAKSFLRWAARSRPVLFDF